MHFAWSESPDQRQLRQGDLLIASRQLKEAIGEAHQYYSEAEDYTHFLVITQSCDLVRRGQTGLKSPYITICAVRPFQILLERVLEKRAHQMGVGRPTSVYDSQYRQELEQFLERALNNTLDSYFFIRSGSHESILEDLCAFLPLSIALRSTHYYTLLDAKVAQLEEVFAAKVGWLVGNLYSRAATPDLTEMVSAPEAYKKAFYAEKLDRGRAWLSTIRWKAVRGMLLQRERNDQTQVTNDVILNEARISQDDMTNLADQIIELIKQAGLDLRAEQEPSLRNLIANDTRLRRIATVIG